jgi:hypothetical protein
MPRKTDGENSSVSFNGILKSKASIDNDNSGRNLIGKYTDAKLGFDAYVYSEGQNNTAYDVKVDYHNGRSETRTLNMDQVDASNCDIIDLFAKMKYIEKEKGVDNPMSNHVLAHFYMENRTQNVDAKTKMNWIDMFQEQLELEYKNGNFKAAQNLEKLLMYL